LVAFWQYRPAPSAPTGCQATSTFRAQLAGGVVPVVPRPATCPIRVPSAQRIHAQGVDGERAVHAAHGALAFIWPASRRPVRLLRVASSKHLQQQSVVGTYDEALRVTTCTLLLRVRFFDVNPARSPKCALSWSMPGSSSLSSKCRPDCRNTTDGARQPSEPLLMVACWWCPSGYKGGREADAGPTSPSTTNFFRCSLVKPVWSARDAGLGQDVGR
jgi:hypothetical protein